MAQEKWHYEYRTNGSEALDSAYLYERESTARPVPKEEPRRSPRPRKAPHPKHRPAERQKMEVAPFAVIGLTLAGIMLVLVIFGYSQVYASAVQVGELEEQLAILQEEGRNLQNQYDTSIDLGRIESRARALGMQQPSEKQIIKLQVPAEDVTVIATQTEPNFIVRAWRAILDTARELWAYLR